MKTSVLYITAVMFALCMCIGCSKYVVEGDVERLEGMVYLFAGDKLLDSAAVVDHKFRFEGKVQRNSRSRFILSDRADGPAQQFGAAFYPEKGVIKVENAPEDVTQYFPQAVYVYGTPGNNYNSFYNRLVGFATVVRIQDEYENGEMDDERRTRYGNLLKSVAYHRDTSNSYDPYYYLTVKSGIADIMFQHIDYITPKPNGGRQCEVKRSPRIGVGQYGFMTYNQKEFEELADQFAVRQIGDQCHQVLHQFDTNDKMLTLTSVTDRPKVKYTLMNFWATWCKYSMDQLPYLQKTYTAFHKRGFEIYAISLDSVRTTWRDSIRINQIPWINVNDPNGIDNFAAQLFAIRAIPSNLLVDKDQIVVAKDLFGDALYQKMEELLGER